MEFRLLYSGQLKGASKHDTRASMKHELRRIFHPQLRRLWNTNRNLKDFAQSSAEPYFKKHPEAGRAPVTYEDRVRYGLEAISYNWERNGFRFVPLITDEFALRCKIDILLLRPDEPHHVMQSGDLDAKLKTIFDALRLPQSLKEADNMGPQDNETPFFCLLADDKLVSQVSIDANQLLILPDQQTIDPNDAFLVVHVQLNHEPPRTFDNIFG